MLGAAVVTRQGVTAADGTFTQARALKASTLIHYKAVCIFPRLSQGTNLESYSDLFVIDDSGAGTGERGTDTWDLSPRS